MKKNYRRTEQVQRQVLLPVFSKLLGMLSLLFVVGLASCSKEDAIIEEPPLVYTEFMNLREVSVNMEEDLIIGTTTDMEYSLNSTNGVDGTWTQASDGNTVVTFVEGKVFVREVGNPDNVRMVVAFGAGMVILANLDDVDINVAEGHITGTNFKIAYSLNSTDGTDGDWIVGSDGNTAVEFVAGNVYVREVKDPANVRLVATIVPPGAAPALEGNDNTNIIVNLDDTHEYKINGGEWTDGTEIPDLTGNKSVQVRIKATATVLASEIQTIVFTPGMYEDFEGNVDLTLLQRGWENNGSGMLNFTTNHSLRPHPSAGGTQSLYVATSGNMTKAFETIENAVVEWKVNPEVSANSAPGVTLWTDEEVDGEIKSVPVVGFNLSGRVLYVYNKSADITDDAGTFGGSGSDRTAVFTAASNTVVLNNWYTFRIEFTGSTYKIFVNGNQVGAASYQTMDGGKHSTINRIRFRSTGAANRIYLDDIKVTAGGS